MLCPITVACIFWHLAYFKFLRGRKNYALFIHVYIHTYITHTYVDTHTFVYIYVCIYVINSIVESSALVNE